ncbi:ABC transporter permease subunit [Rhodobacteraceae bacterium NNCM2]|nr:ABC transporter permease subunit [Coraliihabitans acroporae]
MAADSAAPAGFTLGTRNTGLALLALALLLVLAKPLLPEALVRVPEAMIPPLADWFNAAFNFVKDDLGLIHVTRAFAEMVEWLLDVTANLLYGKNRWPRIGPIPWTVIAVSAFMIGYALRGWALGLLSGGTFVWIAMLGQWKWAMETLSVIVVAAPLAILTGLVLGIAAWRRRWVEVALNPILNLAQSMPHFVYMIPVVVFIGVGPKAGAIATIIFATPPMVRMTLLGLKKVPPEVIESGQMCGSTTWQLLRHVRLPTARDDILIGVNQVIMQCLAMVVLAAFIGMPGLGVKLLQLMQSLKIGRSIEIGITIVLIAVVLDRCSKAWVDLQPVHWERGTPWWERNRLLLIWAGLAAAAFVAAQIWDQAHVIKRREGFTTAKDLDVVVDAFLTMVEAHTLAFKNFVIVNILVPIRSVFLYLPYTAVLAAAAGVGWLVGGRRSALICLGFMAFLALSGWWDRAMITAYTVAVATAVAVAIGLPLGIWGAATEKRARIILLVLDTAQTFPSFIYIIPVIMLFQVNDVAVIGAVIVFGLVPLTRYTIEGLRSVPASMIEAADMGGATGWQKLVSVKLPLALPTMMVGLNQTILFSLFMVIIAAFIGTQDLGQEMQRALSASDFGKGLVLGLCVAFMGLMGDHMLMRWSSDRKRALGLD